MDPDQGYGSDPDNQRQEFIVDLAMSDEESTYDSGFCSEEASSVDSL